MIQLNIVILLIIHVIVVVVIDNNCANVVMMMAIISIRATRTSIVLAAIKGTFVMALIVATAAIANAIRHGQAYHDMMFVSLLVKNEERCDDSPDGQ